ncbi:hypothetical protein HDU99_002575 [Rhizoclosmatium hyalinum]|nr:hypothetical protein HDU99_002575 [Rhizoclosmatium hyalinum]
MSSPAKRPAADQTSAEVEVPKQKRQRTKKAVPVDAAADLLTLSASQVQKLHDAFALISETFASLLPHQSTSTSTTTTTATATTSKKTPIHTDSATHTDAEDETSSSTSKKPKKQKREKRDPALPKQPRTSFQLFMDEKSEEYKSAGTAMQFKEIMRECGALWKEMSEAQKKVRCPLRSELFLSAAKKERVVVRERLKKLD